MKRTYRSLEVTMTDIVISAIIGIIAVIFIGLAVADFIDTSARYDKCKEIVTTVSNVKEKRTTGKHRRTYYMVTYEYTVGDKTYTAKERSESYVAMDSRSFGYYYTDDPRIFYAEKSYSSAWMFTALAALFVSLTIGSVIEAKTKADEEKAKAYHSIIRGFNVCLLGLVLLFSDVFRISDIPYIAIFLLVGVLFVAAGIISLKKLKDERYGY